MFVTTFKYHNAKFLALCLAHKKYSEIAVTVVGLEFGREILKSHFIHEKPKAQ